MAVGNILAQNDLLPILQATLTQGPSPSQTIVDLTGCSVTLRMINAANQTVVLNGVPCTIVLPASSGQVTYTWQPGDTSVVGTYLLQFRVVVPTGGFYHFPNSGGFSLTITATV